MMKRSKVPVSNITKDEREAMRELRKDKNIMVLPADKGKATVVIDREDYDKKIKSLLEDTSVYEVLKKDPTQTYKNRMLKFLRKWRREETISQRLYDKIYPTSEEVPKFYGLPKIHKKGAPLRPIVSGI